MEEKLEPIEFLELKEDYYSFAFYGFYVDSDKEELSQVKDL